MGTIFLDLMHYHSRDVPMHHFWFMHVVAECGAAKAMHMLDAGNSLEITFKGEMKRKKTTLPRVNQIPLQFNIGII